MRIGFEVDSALDERLKSIPHGMRSECLRRLSRMLVDVHDKFGTAGLGALVGGDFVLVPRNVQPLNKIEERSEA